MRKLKNDDGYRITRAKDWNGYYITIASTKANLYVHYEYDGVCGTYEEVEEFLKKNDFYTVLKAFKDQCVYMECSERIW